MFVVAPLKEVSVRGCTITIMYVCKRLLIYYCWMSGPLYTVSVTGNKKQRYSSEPTTLSILNIGLRVWKYHYQPTLCIALHVPPNIPA